MDFNSKAFARRFHYEGNDLGARLTEAGTEFRLWAPTAETVQLRLFRGLFIWMRFRLCVRWLFFRMLPGRGQSAIGDKSSWAFGNKETFVAGKPAFFMHVGETHGQGRKRSNRRGTRDKDHCAGRLCHFGKACLRGV